MPTHLGFLRAVNVGKRQFKTADLRAVLEGAGYGNVETYIQTGNVRIDAPTRSQKRVEAELEALFLADRGFEVPTIVLSPAELVRVAEDAEELIAKHQPQYNAYVSLLKQELSAATAAAVEGLSQAGELLVVRGRAVHLLYDVPFGEAKIPGQIEKIAGVATNRNAKVIRTLAQKWG